jgi:NADPH-dependent curcumin reductase CurA
MERKRMMTRQIFLAARPSGQAKLSDFSLREVPLPPVGNGELQLKGCFLSLDPYMRGRMDDRESYAPPLRVGDVMTGEAVCVVEASKHPGYKPGDVVLAPTGWQTEFVCRGDGLRKVDTQVAPMSAYLGVLGMPGFTAYAGLKAIGKPAEGETVVVSSAAGAVGSLVGQLAKIGGARAVGIAGGRNKCALVKEEFGFDAAVDYKAKDFPEALAAACPKGVDIYFENVGGALWQAVLPLLNQFARVPVCGLIAYYDRGYPKGEDLLPETMRQILSKRITVRGFINFDFASEYFPDFVREVSEWVKEGRIRYREHIVDGLEKAPEAFIGMLNGENLGKALVRLT